MPQQASSSHSDPQQSPPPTTSPPPSSQEAILSQIIPPPASQQTTLQHPPHQYPALQPARPLQPPFTPQCWDPCCNGQEFASLSNLLRHQRRRGCSMITRAICPRCGKEFTRSTARTNHLLNGKCEAKAVQAYESRREEMRCAGAVKASDRVSKGSGRPEEVGSVKRSCEEILA